MGQLEGRDPGQLNRILDTSAVDAIDEQIAKATDPVDIARLVSARGRVIRQNVAAAKAEADIMIQLEEQRFTRNLSVVALVMGFTLIQTGWWIPGFLCLGAALYRLAPSFVTDYFGRFFGRDDAQGDENDDE
jgi:hypothetical protein